MSNSLSPYDMAANMTSYAPNPYRTARTSNSQSAHSYRVEKPRSNHNSPRTVERRKTTTGAKLYATLDDHYNMMMGITGDEDAVEPMGEPANTRPMSWHPSSNQCHARPQSAMFDQPENWPQNYSSSSRNSVHGSDFYSLSSRNSMGADTAQQYSNYTTGQQAHRGSQDSDASWQTQQSYFQSSYSTPATESMPWYLQEWARKNQDQAVASQNGSMEFLPIQHPTEGEEQNADVNMEEEGKELIGMGLYDVSDSSLDWSSSLGEATGKGLKLEETWQPPEDDDEEEEQDDDASSDDGEEELPPPPAPIAPVASAKAQPTGNMEGQSFFFDEDDNITKEWWYQHLKQPSLPVRDAGYGYGWL
ncbi:hypothetical protein SLS60_004385 [Paraconiothyrium brasiliense]|uniref:Uncharacterized protein n=1 Tax=Paraconiothyrium brasiliense TaxID=300254 RepID=A0ABR3RK89_9PLEO